MTGESGGKLREITSRVSLPSFLAFQWGCNTLHQRSSSFFLLVMCSL